MTKQPNIFKKVASLKHVREGEGKRSVLFGTGLTRRVAEQATRQYKRVLEGEYEAKEEQIESALRVGAIHELPDTLMPDDITLDDSQHQAVAGCLHNRFACVIGAAGTGKTTCTRFILAHIVPKLREISHPLRDVRIKSIAIVSYTGRAVQQLKRALPRELHKNCDTAHGTLGYTPVIEEYKCKDTGEWKMHRVFVPSFNEHSKFTYDVIIIDETGMMPVWLFNQVVAASRDGTRFILVGDINQLPPVHGRSILGYAMLEWPTYELTHIHRTDENALLENAWRVLSGRMPIERRPQFMMKNINDSPANVMLRVLGIVQHLHKLDAFDPMTDALIVPQNKGTVGQVQLNEHLVHYFNPLIKDGDQIINPRIVVTAGYEKCHFAVGDKIMLKVNIRPLNLTNGQIGVIKHIALNGAFRGDAAAQGAGEIKPINAPSLNFDDLDRLDAGIEKNGANNNNDDEEERERQASHILTIEFQNTEGEHTFQTAGAVNALTHAYAITCHKAQGGEFPTVVVLCHSHNRRMLTREWLYTAITRAQKRVILLHDDRGLMQAINTQRIQGNTLQDKARSFLALQGTSSVEPELWPAEELAVET